MRPSPSQRHGSWRISYGCAGCSWLETEPELSAEIDAGRAELRGWVAHESVPEELSRLELLVLPARPTEGLPTTILESLACGTPVYATPVSDVPDVVRDGETGFLVDSSAPGDVAVGIAEILDRDDVGAVSARGRRSIEEEYSFHAAVARYRGILETVQQTR